MSDNTFGSVFVALPVTKSYRLDGGKDALGSTQRTQRVPIPFIDAVVDGSDPTTSVVHCRGMVYEVSLSPPVLLEKIRVAALERLYEEQSLSCEAMQRVTMERIYGITPMISGRGCLLVGETLFLGPISGKETNLPRWERLEALRVGKTPLLIVAVQHPHVSEPTDQRNRYRVAAPGVERPLPDLIESCEVMVSLRVSERLP